MQQQFTKDFMRDNCGCYSEKKLNQCSFMKVEGDTIALEGIIDSEIPLKDKFWFVCRRLATKEQNQQIAIRIAEIVLPIYEKRYPDNKAPREAIEAAKQYLAGHISLETLLIKRRAAADAAFTAFTAYAAYAYAAFTAYAAAADAADAYAAAAYAADADAAAAYAADADAAAADIKQQLLDYLKQLTTNI